MRFEEELDRVLPADLPNRGRVIEKSTRHLVLIAEANTYMNLTRIVSARDAAVKHVYDSLAPWRFFVDARRVLDAGTGAGFPGIPLALALADTRFVLTDSTGKKARFVEAAAEELGLANVEVTAERAEQISATREFDLITARAVAPISRLIDLFERPLRNGVRLLLYKGLNADAELADAQQCGALAEALFRYELPDGLGSRCLIEIRRDDQPRKRARASRR